MAEAGYYSTPMGPAGPKKKLEKPPKTMRFSLDLAESDELSCPEYSWLKLLREAAENDEQKVLECLDPFAAKDLEEQKKLEALARSFEEKYSTYSDGRKRKKIKFQDLLDVGDGYDENDPFVDNSEAYDELVPETLTTKLGGFYINSGQLDFKELPVDHSHSDEEMVPKKKKKRKLTIESDSESSTASDIIRKKKKLLKKALKEAAKSSDSDSTANKLANKTAKKKHEKPEKKRLFTGNILLKRQKLEKAKKLKKAALDTRTPTKNKVHENGAKEIMNGPKLMESLDSTFAEVLGQPKPSSPSTKATIQHNSNTPKNSPSKSGGDSQENGDKLCPENAPALPDMVPSLKLAVEKIKQAAKVGSEGGKQKFFNDDVNKLLLTIELGSRQHSCGQRSTIYNHLAAYLPCSKDTLLKRAKKLRENEHGAKLQDPKVKLKEAIEKVMPAMIERYEKALQQHALAKSEESGANKEGSKEENSTAESDEDESKKDSGKEGEEKKKLCMPRRRFTWNPEIRKLLCDLVQAKMEQFDFTKQRSQSAADYLKAYLDAEIKGLWPKGWMHTRMLMKESRSAHTPWTSGNGKPVKKAPSVTKVTSSTPNTPTGSLSGTRVDKSESKNEDSDIFDFLDVDEEGDVKTEGDTASMLNSFLESEVLKMEIDKIEKIEKTEPTKPKVKVKKDTKEEKAKPTPPTTPKDAHMPPPKSKSEHSFMAQFEKFMKQNGEGTPSPVSGPRQPFYPSPPSPVRSPNSASKSPLQDAKKLFPSSANTSEVWDLSPPKRQAGKSESSLDIMLPNASASEDMNSFAKFTQQKNLGRNQQPLNMAQPSRPVSSPQQQSTPRSTAQTQPQQRPVTSPSQQRPQIPSPSPQQHRVQAHSQSQRPQERPVQQPQQHMAPSQPQQHRSQPQHQQYSQHPAQRAKQPEHPLSLSPQHHQLQQQRSQQQQSRPQQQQSRPQQQQSRPQQQQSRPQQQPAPQRPQPAQQTSPKGIWSPASSALPNYISPISPTSPYPQGKMDHSLPGSKMAAASGAMSASASMAAAASSVAAASSAQRERSIFDLYNDSMLAAQRQQYMEQASAMAGMKSPSLYGLPSSPVLKMHSPQHPPHSPQGVYPGHSPSTPPQRHPLLQQPALSPHQYRQYAQDQQPRPY